MTITYGIGYPRSEDILKFIEMISRDLISVCDVRKILELRSHMKLNDFFPIWQTRAVSGFLTPHVRFGSSSNDTLESGVTQICRISLE